MDQQTHLVKSAITCSELLIETLEQGVKNVQSRLYKKEREKNFSSLNPSFVKDNKLFWKTVKPFFSKKWNLGPNIKLVEKNELIQNDQEIANELNIFFKDTASNLGINENP